MGAVAFLLVWYGYSVFVDGLATVRGCNVSWSDLAIPGRWAQSNGCSADAGADDGSQYATRDNQFPSKGFPQGKNTQVKIGDGRTTASQNLPGGVGNPFGG